jgi:cytochrome c oxidase cbb3-type subunit IV
MKFINYLSTIAGIEIFPLISLTIFFMFFVALFIYVFTTKKEHIAEVEIIPLNDSTKNDNDLNP